jgi:hypothetical protein
VRVHFPIPAAVCGLAVALTAAAWAQGAAHSEGQPASAVPHVNQLSKKEKEAGWKLLFDGKSTAGWRNYQKQDVSKGWQVMDGALCRMDNTAGDLITVDQYGDFELELHYKVPAHANSGVMYRVSEDQPRAWHTGPEIQLLDNTDPSGDSQKAGWAYGLYQPAVDPKTGKPLDATKPIGEWNHLRIILNGPHVEHWMNGVKYVEYEIGSEDWNKRLAASKFGKMPRFAKNTQGHLVLQGDHGNVCFTNIKIRPLPAK